MKLFAKARRRKAGIYLARTRKNQGRRRENGYVGRSNNMPMRWKCHMGTCSHKQHKAKPWSDLDVRWKRIIPLPWWLSWRWVQAPLEYAAIKLLLPRYNYQHNLTNPRRVPLYLQAVQRAVRDRGLSPAPRNTSTLLTALGVLLILVGLGMTVWTNR